MERVTFRSGSETLVGHLHRPEGAGPFPGAVLLGPLTSVKEQATGAYAAALARRGWAALSFDPRYFGESEGEPRQYEDPEAKIEDAVAAADFLATHPAVNGDRLAAVGVCAGAGYIAGAVAAEPRLKAFGAVAGFYHDASKQREWMGDEGFEAAVQRAIEAREKWEQDRVAETIPAVAESGERAMPMDEAFTYYGTPRGGQLGHYVNAFAVMSREKTLRYDAQSRAERITVPTVMIHSERALAPALARTFFERLASADKELRWVESDGQIDFYDDPQRIEPAVDMLDEALRRSV